MSKSTLATQAYVDAAVKATVVATGTAVLAAGAVTVANTSITATSRIRLAYAARSGTPGAVFVSALTAGASFAIASTSAADTSTVYYEILSY